MNFLNVGPWELTVVLMIAILMIGPKKMVELARTVRRYATQLRKLSGEFTTVLQSEIQATEQGARQVLSEVREIVEETQSIAAGALTEFRTAEKGATSSVVSAQIPGEDEKSPTSQASQEAIAAIETFKADEPRPFVDVVKDGLGLSSIQAEMQAIGQEARQVLDSALSGGLTLSSLQEEIQAVGQETRQAVEDVGQAVQSSVASISVVPTEPQSVEPGTPQNSGRRAEAASQGGDPSGTSPDKQHSTALETVLPRSPLEDTDGEQAGSGDSPEAKPQRIAKETAQPERDLTTGAGQ